MQLELRMALEPWHVLGEEVTSQGTARYVDSSVERLQVRVTRDDRRPLRRRLQRPARAAARHRHARRVRRRRALPRLAAAVGAASDDRRCTRRWSSTSSTPGTTARSAAAPTTSPTRAAATTRPSRSTPTRPRRAAWPRFWPHGHTPGPMATPPEERNREFPYTLDLRYRDHA